MNVFRIKKETQKSVDIDRIEKSIKNRVKSKKMNNRKNKNSKIHMILQNNSVYSSEMDAVSKSIGKKYYF